MKFKSIIFDLDGTLVDTLEDIYRAVNRALEDFHFPTHEKNAYLPKIGRGWRNLCTQALPAENRDDITIQQIFETSYRYYESAPAAFSKPYPGILDLLAELQRAKVNMAVLTNKPDPLAQKIIAELFPAGTFSTVFGEREGVSRKPDPASTWEIIMELNSDPKHTIFIGDSEVDIETAKAAACHALGVSWGFRERSVLEETGAERIIDTPSDLLKIIREA
ncbi:MAG: HAD-IA family hydrolase [Treponema sp.]|jgi:phosphoglycolate phosphatase|nr:HAD-IA family hydrolase [Treponema sp.]